MVYLESYAVAVDSEKDDTPIDVGLIVTEPVEAVQHIVTWVLHERSCHGQRYGTHFDLERRGGVFYQHTAAIGYIYIFYLAFYETYFWSRAKQPEMKVQLAPVLGNTWQVALWKRNGYTRSCPLLWAAWCSTLSKEVTLMARMSLKALDSKERSGLWV